MELFAINVVSISLFFILISALLYQKASGSLGVFSIPTAFFYFYLIFVYIGSVIILFKLDPYIVRLGATKSDILWLLYATTTIGFFLIPSGMLCANKILKFEPKKKLNQYLRADIEMVVSPKDSYVMPFFYLFCVFALLMTLLYIRKVDTLPFVGLMKGGDAATLALLRSEATNTFAGKAHWYRLAYKHVIPFLSLVALTYFLRTKGRIKQKWLLIFLTLFPISCFTNFMNLIKGPLILYWGSIIILLSFIRPQFITFRKIFIFGSFCLIVVILMYIYVMGQEDRPLLELSLLPLQRIFVGQISGLYFYYDFFPKHHDFLLGLSFPNPHGIMPYRPYRLTVEVKNYVLPDLASKGIVGSMPTVFWGEVYANFGLISIFPAMFFVGFFIQIVHIIFFKFLKKSTLTISLMVYSIIHFCALTCTSLSNFLLDSFLGFIMLIVIIMIIGGRALAKFRMANL